MKRSATAITVSPNRPLRLGYATVNLCASRELHFSGKSSLALEAKIPSCVRQHRMVSSLLDWLYTILYRETVESE
jgi:hypothetical protein